MSGYTLREMVTNQDLFLGLIEELFEPYGGRSLRRSPRIKKVYESFLDQTPSILLDEVVIPDQELLTTVLTSLMKHFLKNFPGMDYANRREQIDIALAYLFQGLDALKLMAVEQFLRPRIKSAQQELDSTLEALSVENPWLVGYPMAINLTKPNGEDED